MVSLIQTPEQVKSGDEPTAPLTPTESDGEPEEELSIQGDAPTSSSEFVYSTPSKK